MGGISNWASELATKLKKRKKNFKEGGLKIKTLQRMSSVGTPFGLGQIGESHDE
jgi:hypothetical protein